MFEETMARRKPLATYGKAARKRLPDYTHFTSISRPLSPSPDVKKSELSPPQSLSPPLVEIRKLKSPTRNSLAMAGSSGSPSKADMYEVPSSDEEIPRPVTKPVRKLAQPIKKPTKTNNTNRVALDFEAEGNERRKRLKTYPVRVQAPQSTLGIPYAKPPTPAAPVQLPLKPSAAAHTAVAHKRTLVTRPHPAIAPSKIERQKTPQKSPPSNFATNTNHSLQHDPDMMDLDDAPTAHISPRGLQMWKDLLDTAEDDERDAAEGDSARALPQVSGKTLFKKAGVVKNQSRPSPKRLPRRRLIDSLVEQSSYRAEMADDTSYAEEPASQSAPGSQVSILNENTKSLSLAPEIPTVPVVTIGPGTQHSGPKFTYKTQRSMLAEADLMAELALDMPSQPAQHHGSRRPRRGSIPTLLPLPGFVEEESESQGKLKSIHELRQEAANSRYTMEVEDMLDRIGEPSEKPSLRRSGLLDLVLQFKNKNFARQFRAHGFEQRLFVHLGKETDSIAGAVMVSILTVILADESMPHIVAQLRRQGITRLLIRLLEGQIPLVPLSRDRKSNMSKTAQSMISDLQDQLLQTPMWEELEPDSVTPRTIALKCLELMIKQTRDARISEDVISKELTTLLFSILKTASKESTWDLPKGEKSIDFYLALSALESHSITARTVQDASIWMNEFLPILADTFEIALSRPLEEFGVLQNLLLKLTCNVTNNNIDATNAVATEGLLTILCHVIVEKFKKISRFLTQGDFAVIQEHLTLAMGVMSNFAESPQVRESLQSLQGKDTDHLPSMIQLFVDHETRTSLAESVEESLKNVAFGFLAVVLGSLSLTPAIAERIALQHPKKTIRPIQAAIEEFIGYHKTADMMSQESEDGQNALTAKLELLLTNMNATKTTAR